MIASDGTRSFMIYLYDQLEWTTGDASGGSGGLGGTEAGVGLSDGANHILYGSSYTQAVLNIQYSSNIGSPGVFVFIAGKAS